MRKVLVLSNDALTDSNANGRTMKMLLKSLDKEHIAQFFIHGVIDTAVCHHYFQVSDKDVIQSLLPTAGRKKRKQTESIDTKNQKIKNKINHPRTCKNMFLRDFAWRTYRWWKADFTEFIESYKPELIILQAGDCPFMFNIAYRIIKKYNLPLLVYNSESYVIRRTLFHGANEHNIWHRLLKKELDKQYRLVMSEKPFCVYNIQKLNDDFQRYYPHEGRSAVVRISSNCNHYEYNQSTKNSDFIVSYCGTLGGGRPAMLAEFADILKKVSAQATLIICGRIETEDELQWFEERDNIDYRGFVSYQEVQQIIEKSDLIIDCNGIERLEARYYEFSTKIADCLACGIPFLSYANRDYPYVKYLELNKAAFVAESKEELIEELNMIINSMEYRCSLLPNALQLAQMNHSPDKNAEIFFNIIERVGESI